VAKEKSFDIKGNAERVLSAAARAWGLQMMATLGAAVTVGASILVPADAYASQAALMALSKPGEATVAAARTASASFLIQHPERIGGDVSHIDVPTMSMTGASVAMALDLALADRGLTVVVRSALSEAASQQTARGAKGNLEQVLNQLSQSLDFFWVAADGVITIDGTRMFSLVVPAAFAADRANVEKTLSAAGAIDVVSVPLDNIVTFRASPSALLTIRQTLDAASTRRALGPVSIAFGPVAAPAPVAVATALVAAPIQPSPATQPAPAAHTAVAPMPTVPAPMFTPQDPAAAAQRSVGDVAASYTAPARKEEIDRVARQIAQGAGSQQSAAAKAEIAPKFWGINVADRTVEGVLRRWARENGWELRYEFDRIPVLRPASVIAVDFLGAVKEVQLQLVEAGYDMDLAAIGSTLRVSPGVNK